MEQEIDKKTFYKKLILRLYDNLSEQGREQIIRLMEETNNDTEQSAKTMEYIIKQAIEFNKQYPEGY